MIQEFLLKGMRKVYRMTTHTQFLGNCWPKDDEWESTNNLLAQLLGSDKPCFVGRMGTVELAIVCNYLSVYSSKSYLKRCIDYVTDNTRMPFWETGKPFYELQNNAGFFFSSNTDNAIKEVERFAELYLREIPNMDVCGQFSDSERYLPFSDSCKMVQLESLYPFFSLHPWTKVLEGKKVLVVHPFKDTILSQYARRRKLFANPDVLPDFDLDVVQAVQTMAGERSRFASWFDALDYMKDEIARRDFDVLIVGCGAYGLPLASFGKSLKKKALHLGGVRNYFLVSRENDGKKIIMEMILVLLIYLTNIGYIQVKMNVRVTPIRWKVAAIGKVL